MLISGFLVVMCLLIDFAESYSKYGRHCEDIGCPSHHTCVMETDPCSFHQKLYVECGSYPICKRISSDTACATYVCPATKVCKMDYNTPKCVDDHGNGSDTQSQDTLGQQGGFHPNQGSQGNLYPGLYSGFQTTPRPNGQIWSGGPKNSSGYFNGQIESGVPGLGTRYPEQLWYPQQGLVRLPGGNPYIGEQGMKQLPPQDFWPKVHPMPESVIRRWNERNNRKFSGAYITDQITSSLKTIGSDSLQNALAIFRMKLKEYIHQH